MNEPRAYRDEQDLKAMLDLLAWGRKANNGSYYIHPGDLKWWLYYPPLEGDFWPYIYLWDDLERPGRLLGWALISPDWVGIDVYITPELRGSQSASEMYMWAEEEAVRVAYRQGRKTVYALWVRHDDSVLTEYFTQRGFKLRRGMMHLSRRLDENVPQAMQADGFALRNCRGLAEVSVRARVQCEAFNSSAAFERYLERFTNFMHSPVYQPELDIVAVAPNGQIGAFCIVWTDPVNQIGLFEPVGTHPEFQRKGLGKAVMLEGMRRLKERGMKGAIVSTLEDNQAGIQLYKSVGFQVAGQLGTFEKDM